MARASGLALVGRRGGQRPDRRHHLRHRRADRPRPRRRRPAGSSSGSAARPPPTAASAPAGRLRAPPPPAGRAARRLRRPHRASSMPPTCSPPQKGASPAQVALLDAAARAAGPGLPGRLRRRRARARGRRRGRRSGRGPGRRSAASSCPASTWWPTSSSSPSASRQADLVVTGEGFVDEQSFEGKVVGGVAELAERGRHPPARGGRRGVRRLRRRVQTISLTDLLRGGALEGRRRRHASKRP